MSGFSIDWLDLREAADRRARDEGLLQRAWQWLHTDMKQADGMTVVDLGAGTGSTLRAFAATAATDSTQQESPCWRLVDRDAALLAEAIRRHGDSLCIETYEADLADIAALPLAGAQLVTASALFDLVSAGYIDSLVKALNDRSLQHPIGTYAALNYNGATSWLPEHPLDGAVLAAFNRDQERDKGFGAALGPNAAIYTEQALKHAGFEVLTADSPWLLDGGDARLVSALIAGIGEAVAVDAALDPIQLQDWVRFRASNAATGACEVGHTDLLALPKAI